MGLVRQAAVIGCVIASIGWVAAEELGSIRPAPRPATLVAPEAGTALSGEGLAGEGLAGEGLAGQGMAGQGTAVDGTVGDGTGGDAAAKEAPALAAPQTQPVIAKPKVPQRDPTRGSVTNLPLPRFVSLKGNEGNARRGPGLTHRIDWVFTRAGMPLKITAEYEHWRRVEDAEGAGGWVHYSLLSGVRSALVAKDIADFRDDPRDDAAVAFQAERNVVGWIQECEADWCRLSVDGEKGWVRKSALWGVDAGEVIE